MPQEQSRGRVNPSSNLLERLLSSFSSQPPMTDEEKAEMERIALEEQAKWPQWKKNIDSTLGTGMGFLEGLVGVEPNAERSSGRDYLNLATQGIGIGALPLAVPRKLHKIILNELQELSKTKFSSTYNKTLSDWSSGNAMHKPNKNLEFAQLLRNADEPKLIQDRLRDILETNTVPLYRGVANRYDKPSELEELKEYFSNQIDPGIRSFSLEPKVTHNFADYRVPFPVTSAFEQSRRAQKGNIYKINAPIDSVLGYGTIPWQFELITDLKSLNPLTRIQSLRSK